MNLGENGKALVHFQQAVRLRPDFAATHSNLGYVLRALSRLEEAEACYRAAIRLQPDLVAALAGLGRVILEQGDTEQAVAAFREALRHEPRNAVVLSQLASAIPGRLSDSERGSIDSLLASTSLSPETALFAPLRPARRLTPAVNLTAPRVSVSRLMPCKGPISKSAACTTTPTRTAISLTG